MAEYVINQYRGVFKRAVELYENEKFKDSFLLFETVVQNDQANYQACYYLGVQLYYGKGCPKNVKRAFQLFMSAASNKITDAAYMVGMCYLEGNGINQDSTQAVAWFTEAAKYAHPLSQYYLGLAYMKGEGINKDIPRAAQWLVHAAKAGVIQAQRDGGLCYEYLGKFKGAAKLFLAGAENGDPLCQEKIADYYAEGKGILQCTELSVHYIQLAADQNNPHAQLKLANRYSLGDGVRLDKKVAFNWYQKAANSEDPASMNALAECYHLGDGCLKNDALAISWWQKAANNGNTPAMIHLAENLTEPSDKNIVQDLVTAKYWWSRAAEAGDAYAMYRLGDCLEHGIGVSVINLEDAFKWYRLASQNGNEDASEATKRFSRSITGKVKIKKVA